MRVAAPRFLPPLRSRKWHNKKGGLAFMRVQHMSCSRSEADMSHILLMLKNRGPVTHDQVDQAHKLLADLARIKQPVWESNEAFHGVEEHLRGKSR